MTMRPGPRDTAPTLLGSSSTQIEVRGSLGSIKTSALAAGKADCSPLPQTIEPSAVDIESGEEEDVLRSCSSRSQTDQVEQYPCHSCNPVRIRNHGDPWKLPRPSMRPPEPYEGSDDDLDFDREKTVGVSPSRDRASSLGTTVGVGPSRDRVSSLTTTSSVVRTLSTAVPADMLQGVGLDYVLEGFGKEIPKRLPRQTARRKVKRYNAFLSHDWRTHRLLKVLSCMMLFNGPPAALSACLTAVICASIETYQAWRRGDCEVTMIGVEEICLYRGRFAFPLSLAVFFGTLCWWQRICAYLLRSPTMVFFDKFSISQTDEVLKAQAISGLAGFLRESESMVILWSPRYFTRLWCVYELASWLELKGKKRPVVMPVLLSVYLALALMVWIILVMTVQLSVVFNTSYQTMMFMQLACVPLTLIPAFAMAIVLADDLAKLPGQLESFAILNANCSCCAMMHVDPVTQAAIPCDREIVLETLQGWYGLEKESNLKLFDLHVKTHLGPEFLKMVRGSPMLYWLVMCTISPVVLCWCIDRFLSVALHGVVPYLRIMMEVIALAFCIVPISCQVCLTVSYVGEHMTQRLPRCVNMIVRFIPAVVIPSICWAPLVPARLMPSIIPQLCFFSLMSLITLYLFCPRSWNFAKQGS